MNTVQPRPVENSRDISSLLGIGLTTALAIGLPLLIFVAFHAINSAHLRSDEAEYLMLAQRLLKRFCNEGFISGIKGIYFDRDWKPSIHGDLWLPFWALAKGNVLFATAMISTFLYFVTSLFTYQTAKLFLTQPNSVIATWLVVLQPLFVTNFRMVRAQASLVMFLAIAIFYFLKWYQERKTKSALIACLAITFAGLCRPIETALLLVFPISYIAVYAVIRFQQYRSQILFTSILLILTILLVTTENEWFFLCLAAASVVAFLPQTKLWNRSCALAAFVVNGWYLHRYDDIVTWASAGARSLHTQNLWNRPSGDFFVFIFQMLNLHFGWIGFGLILMSIAFRGRSRSRAYIQLISLISLTAILPFVAGALSINGSYWFFYNGYYVGTLSLVIFALIPSSAWPRVRTVLAACLAGFYIIPLFKNLHPVDSVDMSWSRPFKGKDPCVTMVENLNLLLKPVIPTEVGVLFYETSSSQLPFLVMDRWCLAAEANARQIPLRFRTYFDGLPGDTRDSIIAKHQLLSNFMMMGPIGAYDSCRYKSKMVETVKYFEDALHDGSVEKTGFHKLEIMSVGADPSENSGKILILKNGYL